MDYLSAFDISASGMAVQHVRLDTVALNLANAYTTRGLDGKVYRKMEVLLAERIPENFDQHLFQGMKTQGIGGVEVADIRAVDLPPRMVYEPGHPDADANGYVAYPNIEPVSEMLTLIEATRGYEANVKAIAAAKSMALRALEIGD
jgi:flagellar basal-body rod protein FlgC